MADHSLPSLTSTYADLLTAIDGRLDDSATMFTGTSYSNQPAGSMRFNRSSSVFEEWSGSAWSTKAISYAGLSFGSIAGLKTDLGLGSLAYISSVNNSNWSGTPLALANGGTGASSASEAMTNLGLGSIATQAASAVAITGGTISGISSLGATTATFSSIEVPSISGTTGSSLTFNCPTGQATVFFTGATSKVTIPAAVTSGSPAFAPSANLTYTLGSTSSQAWSDVVSGAFTSPSGVDLNIRSQSSQAIKFLVGGSTKAQITAAGKLEVGTPPDYTTFSHTTRRSLDPSVATAQQCADAINTIMTDLISIGLFQ